MSGKPGLYRSYTAAGVIAAYRIVGFGEPANTVAQAADGSKFLVGTTQIVGADEAGQLVDVVRDGLPEVQYGGVVAKGDPLTSDADGKAIKATPAPGQHAYIIGFAEEDGVEDDICLYFASPDIVNG